VNVTLKRCASCPAEVIWAVTRNGRPMPVDAEPSEAGNVRLVAREGASPRAEIVQHVDRREGEALRTSHFVTCPNAVKHRTHRRPR
jgi:hypothetical protein